MKHIVLAFIISSLLFSCKKRNETQGPEGDQGAIGPAGSMPSGTIIGKVTQYDEFANNLTTGLNTITVSIKSTSISTVTDEKGIYTIPSVPPGTYVLEFKGPKTQLCKNNQVSCTGNGTVFIHASIYDKPSWTFSNAYIRDSVNLDIIKISSEVTQPPTGKYRTFIVLFGRDSNLVTTNPLSYDFSKLFSGRQHIITSAHSFIKYPSGTKYYARLYSLTSPDSWYFDYSTKQNLYYSVGDMPSKVFTLTMP